MNSQDGAVCGSNGEMLALLLSKCGGIEANCGGTEVGGISGDDARVVPDQNEPRWGHSHIDGWQR